jgi:hypothetical protein
MASKFAYSRALRTVGQALEKRQIDLFDLRCDQNEYFLQCGDPTPPHLSLVELRYTFADLHDLDLDARDNERASYCRSAIANRPALTGQFNWNIKPAMEKGMWKNSIWRRWKTTPYACIRNARVSQTHVPGGSRVPEDIRSAGQRDGRLINSFFNLGQTSVAALRIRDSSGSCRGSARATAATGSG